MDLQMFKQYIENLEQENILAGQLLEELFILKSESELLNNQLIELMSEENLSLAQ